MKDPTASPLCWPLGWPRTPDYQRKRASFNTKYTKTRTRYDGTEVRSQQSRSLNIGEAVSRLMSELQRFGWRRVDPDAAVVSTDLRLRLDGLPYANQRNPEDPGVAVYFTLDGERVVLACDRWDRIADNIAAIAAHIGALRGQERWGVGTLAQAFAGYKALPEPKGLKQSWWNVLGVAHNASREDIIAAFRAMAKEAHPDAGGNEQWMKSLVEARDEALSQFNNGEPTHV